jgi:hypothetical protein
MCSQCLHLYPSATRQMANATRQTPINNAQSPLEGTRPGKRKRDEDCKEDLSAGSIWKHRKRQRDAGNLRKHILRKAADSQHFRSLFPKPKTSSRHRNSSRSTTFAFQESQIEIVEIVGSTSHYIIFRILLGGQSYHLYMVRSIYYMLCLL